VKNAARRMVWKVSFQFFIYISFVVVKFF